MLVLQAALALSEVCQPPTLNTVCCPETSRAAAARPSPVPLMFVTLSVTSQGDTLASQLSDTRKTVCSHLTVMMKSFTFMMIYVVFSCVFVRACVFRSYLTPVRDEESESQRKARSRQARQSRRSTQVSLSVIAL